MSATQHLIARLRRSLGVDDPLSPADPALRLSPPARRVYPVQAKKTRYAQEAAAHTTALVGIGHVGTRYATQVALQFQAELAVAHHAVASLLPDTWREQHGLLALDSQASDHQEYLLRPDLGRRLDAASRARLEQEALKDVDVQPILADGLSALACMGAGIEALEALTRACERRGLRLGTPMCARRARVWIEDEIGALVRARVAIILLGERPGLGTGDGLSAYLVHAPAVGKTDSERNMISNIHARGMAPGDAALRLAEMAAAMIEQGTSGVDLDLSGLGHQPASGTLRAPQIREPLVESPR